jgi:hypothetical protein
MKENLLQHAVRGHADRLARLEQKTNGAAKVDDVQRVIDSLAQIIKDDAIDPLWTKIESIEKQIWEAREKLRIAIRATRHHATLGRSPPQGNQGPGAEILRCMAGRRRIRRGQLRHV